MSRRNTPACQLRAATLQDAPELAGLLGQLGYPTMPAEMRERLRHILPDPDYSTVVAEISGKVVGLVGVRQSYYYEHNGSYGQIVVLVVDQAWRGQHLGQHLLAEAERWLQNQDIQVVLVNSGTARTEAHRFYHQQGYQTTGLRFVKVLVHQAGQPPDRQS
jgi:ribosomal protein S18 acetylase RimI-like enzyme